MDLITAMIDHGSSGQIYNKSESDQTFSSDFVIWNNGARKYLGAR